MLIVDFDSLFKKMFRPSGKTFEVPYTERKDSISLKKGDIVTFGYTKQSQQSVPSDPFILRVRKDTTWEDILFQYYKENNLPGTSPFSLSLLLCLIIYQRNCEGQRICVFY